MMDDDCRGLDYPRSWDLSQSMNWDFLLTNQYNGTTLWLLNTAHVPVPFNSCWLLIRAILCYATLYMVFTMFYHNPSCESPQITLPSSDPTFFGPSVRSESPEPRDERGNRKKKGR